LIVALIPLVVFAVAAVKLGRGFLPITLIGEVYDAATQFDCASIRERWIAHEKHVRKYLSTGIQLMSAGVVLAFLAVLAVTAIMYPASFGIGS
jgi:hypothetical protein